jgi:hypothetical protein
MNETALFQQLETDPRAVLEALVKGEVNVPHHRALTARILAHIALRETQAAFDAFRAYLGACRAAGGFGVEPPFDALELFFEEMNERAWANEVREVAAMECGQLLGRVIAGDPTELNQVSAQLDQQLEKSGESGAEVARTCSLKACVLTKLGKKAEALKFWSRAKKAAPEVAEFWSTNSLLA